MNISVQHTEHSIRAADGGTLFAVSAGPAAGEAVVCLHGHGADHLMWAPQIDRYSREGYRVIVPDIRGHGRSARAERLTVGDWAEDVHALLRHFSLQRVHLIGVSMGGVIAGEFACRYPQHLSSLVLADTFGKLRSFKEKAVGASVVWAFRLMRLLPRNMFIAQITGAYDFPGGEAAARYFKRATEQADFDQLILTRRALYQVDTEERLADFPGPALVLAGERAGDFFVNFSRRLARSLNTEPVLLAGGMDPSNLTAQEEFDSRVLWFLAEASQRGSGSSAAAGAV
jgi:pimeloyl-ACP methyl ester carboxylesterase